MEVRNWRFKIDWASQPRPQDAFPWLWKWAPPPKPTSSPGLFPQKMGEGKALGTRLRQSQGEAPWERGCGLALQLEVNLPFLLSFTLYLRTIFQVQAPGGLKFGGAI